MRGRDCCWKFADHSHPAAEVSQSVFWLCAARALMVPAFGLNGNVAEAAKSLGTKESVLVKKMKKWGINDN